MNQIPQSFLLVNHEGIHRCYISIEQVANFEQLLSKFSQNKLILVRDLAVNPYGVIHLAFHTGNRYPIAILEAFKGTMGLATQYHLVKNKEGQQWLSPCFLNKENSSFELRCEFDFAVWAQSGIKIFFAVNCHEHQLNIWTYWDRQIYRAPFANIFDNTGILCLGREAKGLEEFYDLPFFGLEKLLTHLSSSVWNEDTFSFHFLEPVASLVRFDPETLKMLPPFKPELITKLGVVGAPTIAEIMKQLFI